MALRARFFLLFVFLPVSLVAACGGASSTGFFAPPCADGGTLCTESEPQDPLGVPEGGAPVRTDGSSTDASGPESDGATFGPCRRDVECATGICNWALELCAVPAPNGSKCRRDSECAGKLCNWETETCSALAPLAGACRRDVECASHLCNWKLEICSNKQPKGGTCRRDVECATGVCNQALDACQ